MKKDEYIRRYGEKAYEGELEQNNERTKIWATNNPDKVKANNAKHNPEVSRKGGKHYEHYREMETTGLRGARNRIRKSHAQKWRPFKRIIAPESQLHHEWIPETADYRGVALVEADQHLHGFIDVIQILEGEITLLTEAEVRTGGMVE